ncbi:MAG: hypothetical protein WB014_12915 [Methanosarcina sp.]
MERDEILFLCHSNPEAILDHINSLEIELSDVKEEVRNLKALLNQNSQDSNRPPSADTFVQKITQRDESQKGHPGSTLKTFDSPHEIVNLRLCNCKFCDYSL